MPYAQKMIQTYGADILFSEGMQSQKNYMQHGNISVYRHCIRVTCLCIYIAALFHLNIDKETLIRGALLHDYFLYDWHVADKSHRLHGFIHARRAMENANRDFTLNKVEQDMILKHMFPLNVKPPKYKESVILCIADKLCALQETCF